MLLRTRGAAVDLWIDGRFHASADAGHRTDDRMCASAQPVVVGGLEATTAVASCAWEAQLTRCYGLTHDVGVDGWEACAANCCAEMENAGPSRAPLISDDPSQRYQRGLNTLKDTQRMVR